MTIDYIFFILAVIYCFDKGVLQTFENTAASLLFRRKVTLGKPFSCLECTAFWASAIYLLVALPLSLDILYISLIASFSSPFIAGLIHFIRKALNVLMYELLKIFD